MHACALSSKLITCEINSQPKSGTDKIRSLFPCEYTSYLLREEVEEEEPEDELLEDELLEVEPETEVELLLEEVDTEAFEPEEFLLELEVVLFTSLLLLLGVARSALLFLDDEVLVEAGVVRSLRLRLVDETLVLEDDDVAAAFLLLLLLLL